MLSVQVAKVAGQIELPTFQPRKGVHIETDPKGTAKPVSSGDDTAVIDNLISQLQVRSYCFLPLSRKDGLLGLAPRYSAS